VNQEEKALELEERSAAWTAPKRPVKPVPWGGRSAPRGRMKKVGLLRARQVDRLSSASGPSVHLVRAIPGAYIQGVTYYVGDQLAAVPGVFTFGQDDPWPSSSDTLQSFAHPAYESSESGPAPELPSSEPDLPAIGQIPIGAEERDAIGKLQSENKQLLLRVELLQAELRKNVPYLQLYRFGAGAFSLSIISLLTWLFAGAAIPFHPMFALAALPVGVVFMVMAWMTRKDVRHAERQS
jgi:hypothetical protein